MTTEQEKTIGNIKASLIPKLAKIAEFMAMSTNPFHVDVPEDASHLSPARVQELIAITSNNVQKAAEYTGAAYAAFKLTEQVHKLRNKRALLNEGTNEQQRLGLAAERSTEEAESLAIAEACYRYMEPTFEAAIVASQSARKLWDSFDEEEKAAARDTRFGRAPEREASV